MNHYGTMYDCPAWNWIEAQKDRRYLLKLENYAVLPQYDIAKLNEAYDLIYDQYLNQFGLTDTEHYLLSLHRDSLELKLEMLDTGSGTLLAQIGVLEKRISEASQSDETGNGLFEVAAVLSRHFGYDISPLKLTVVEFFSKLKLYEKEILAQNSKNNKGNG